MSSTEFGGGGGSYYKMSTDSKWTYMKFPVFVAIWVVDYVGGGGTGEDF